MVGSTTVGVNTSSSFYLVSWGALREIDSTTMQVVKAIDLALVPLLRIVQVNASYVFVRFNGTASYGIWQTHPIGITLVAVYSRFGAINHDLQSPTFLKLSIFLEGLWQFNRSQNTLHIDFSLRGAFESDQCGVSYRTVSQTKNQSVVELYAPNGTTVRFSFLRYCFIDDSPVLQPMDVENPRISNGSATFELIFPSFVDQLAYDPSFAVLLGDLFSGACSNPLLSWILPSAFLIGAAVIIIFVIILGSTPWLRPFVLGSEGLRVYKLRTIVNHQVLEENIVPTTDALQPEESGW